MGFHICHLCAKQPIEKTQFPQTSSGDVNLAFGEDRRWVMPDMILHYVADHGWRPPEAFIADVMTRQLVDSHRRQTRSITDVMDGRAVGYLHGDIHRQDVPAGFIEKLKRLMEEATAAGGRIQTKGMGFC